ncbi:MAG: hypothetical protein ABI878_10085 [Acidobacteriota bacterium]
MAEESSTGSNAVWAIAFVVVVAIIAALVYYSGVLKTNPKKEVDIKVTTPAATPAPAQPASSAPSR